jgi:hypothetical protein
MRRWIFNIAAVFSMLLFAALLTLWIRSYEHEEGIAMVWFDTPPNAPSAGEYFVIVEGDTLYVAKGGLWLTWMGSGPQSSGWSRRLNRPGFYSHPVPAPQNPLHSSNIDEGPWTLGFACGRVDYPSFSGQPAEYRVRSPLWFPTLLTLTMPMLWLHCRRKCRRLRLSGFCVKCGYDLRASKDRCPECGTPIPTKASN